MTSTKSSAPIVCPSWMIIPACSILIACPHAVTVNDEYIGYFIPMDFDASKRDTLTFGEVDVSVSVTRVVKKTVPGYVFDSMGVQGSACGRWLWEKDYFGCGSIYNTGISLFR
ncbi:hypothetical protein BJY04DRAFT_224338 [Aspergillus karnatakaensis]|uniref:uncharacterized protein n=1 Tax=Aspergillus karnatakaensis TaxID=1810916 RepID=UPI003CCCF7AD